MFKEIVFQELYIFISVKITDYSFTKYINLSSSYVLISGDSEYVTYIFR